MSPLRLRAHVLQFLLAFMALLAVALCLAALGPDEVRPMDGAAAQPVLSAGATAVEPQRSGRAEDAPSR